MSTSCARCALHAEERSLAEIRRAAERTTWLGVRRNAAVDGELGSVERQFAGGLICGASWEAARRAHDGGVPRDSLPSASSARAGRYTRA